MQSGNHYDISKQQRSCRPATLPEAFLKNRTVRGSGDSAARVALIVLSMAVFINAYDTTSMNVALSNIVHDLHTTVTGVQGAITTYALVMAAFMITGAKLGDIIGRRRAFTLGVAMYGLGAGITAISPNLGIMFLGWSLLEGLGSALMIPAVFTLIVSNFAEGKARTAGFAAVAAMTAIGAAMGPLLGGLITTFVTWRLSFAMEVGIVCIVISLRGRIADAPLEGSRPKMDYVGVVLSALGLACIVLGILLAGTYGWLKARQPFAIGGAVLLDKGGVSPVPILVGLGVLILAAFIAWQVRRQHRGKEPLVHVGIFRHRALTSGLLVTLVQMFSQGGFMFVIPVFLQISLQYSAFKTGLTLLPLTIAIFIASRGAVRLSERFSQRVLVQIGFLILISGIIVTAFTMHSGVSGWAFIPGFALIGIGLGVGNPPVPNLMLSAVDTSQQSEASGLSRSISNLGTSLGTAVTGAVLIATLITAMTARTQQSTVLPDNIKQDVITALNGNVQTVSNTQLQQYLESTQADQATAAEIERIYANSRDRGIRTAVFSVGILALLGFLATFLLPRVAPPTRKRKRRKFTAPVESSD